MERGYFGIGIYQTKCEANIGTLWRSAYIYGADFIFTIGKRYKRQSSDTTKTPRHIPLFEYLDFEDFNSHRPQQSRLIGIELDDKSRPLTNFIHPDQAIYLLGAEDHGIPSKILERCNSVLYIPTPNDFCLNVAVAGSLILHDRSTKCSSK